MNTEDTTQSEALQVPSEQELSPAGVEPVQYAELPTTAARFQNGRITVYPPTKSIFHEDQWEPAQVNWSAIGAQTPQVAYDFAQELMKAAMLCAEWNRAFGAAFKPEEQP